MHIFPFQGAARTLCGVNEAHAKEYVAPELCGTCKKMFFKQNPGKTLDQAIKSGRPAKETGELSDLDEDPPKPGMINPHTHPDVWKRVRRREYGLAGWNLRRDSDEIDRLVEGDFQLRLSMNMGLADAPPDSPVPKARLTDERTPPPKTTASYDGVPLEDYMKAPAPLTAVDGIRFGKIDDSRFVAQIANIGDGGCIIDQREPNKEIMIHVPIDMKALLVKSVKQGASAGAMKAVSRKLTKLVAKKYPMVMAIPENIRGLAVALILNQLASLRPEAPGAATTEKITAMATEALVTTASAELVDSLLGQVGPLFEMIEKGFKTSKLLDD